MAKSRTKLRTVLAVFLCKLARKCMHLAGKGGTTLPGRLALAVDKEILSRTSRGMHVILVTGTNGKTTTSRMLEKAVQLDGKKCLLNRSGANLLPGITAEFACHTDGLGRPLSHYAVMECDEGALKQVTARLRPEAIVVTNLFRDQLDRYGEVMHTREEILLGIQNAPESILCLNADCPLTASLADFFTQPVRYYGVNTPGPEQAPGALSDAKYCLRCGAALEYQYHTYAHLGAYYCPECQNRRKTPSFAVTEIEEAGDSFSRVKLQIEEDVVSVRIGLPAMYNIYNALAAVSAGTAAGIGRESLLGALSAAEAPFGRMEAFALGDCRIQMILVKNPAGCNQALEYITGLKTEYGICFGLNDRTADGHDISWIWDADTERIVEDVHRKHIWVCGTRAEDMQLRLKYAGAKEEEISLKKDYSRLIDDMARQEKRIFVLPNYTSMLDFREALLQKTGGEAFWKG